MQKQVITILPTGEVTGLQVKPGKGVDLRKLGSKAHIERVSVIQWSDEMQMWYVDVLQEVGRGHLTVTKWTEACFPQIVGVDDLGLRAITVVTARAAMDQLIDHGQRVGNYGDDTIYFDEYDDAVKAEIEFLNLLRVEGQF